MNNIIQDSWPVILTPKNLKQNVRIYGADGVECKYAFEVNRLTGECWQFSTNEDGEFYLIGEATAVERVMLKVPITIIEVECTDEEVGHLGLARRRFLRGLIGISKVAEMLRVTVNEAQELTARWLDGSKENRYEWE